MSKLIFVWCICVLLCGMGYAATVPPPLPQTVEVADLEPAFVPLEDTLATPTTMPTEIFTTKTIVEDEREIEDAVFWKKIGEEQLRRNLKIGMKAGDTGIKQKAKNIIIFVGDGMGLTTITAGRIYKGQLNNNRGEDEMLAFDEFPYTGLAKTYNVDKQVPDSAGTATAMFCGIKTDYGAIGMDTTRSKTNGTQGRLLSIMDWAQAEGKRTGIVTTTRITHATPAATYARIYHRDWECDTEVPQESVGHHVDIARQLVENAPGNKFNVIMGGGLSPMGALNKQETKKVKFEGDTETICTRGDNRNLADEWLQLGGDAEAKDSRIFVQTREQLMEVDVEKVDHVLGLFRNNHITYSIAREEGEPSLKDMTEAAIGVLERGKSSKGYVLLVEGGRIDQAHHQNYARAALNEVVEFDKAIAAALELTDEKETLIIVTADHSHAVTLNGYPKRGGDILGFANKVTSPVIYETITYANGPGFWDHLANDTKRPNVFLPLEQYTVEQRSSPTYRHMATAGLDDETHGGEDVIVFAHGPGSSLVRGVFEQNFVAYIMSYAGCMGPAKNFDNTCNKTGVRNGAPDTMHSTSLVSLLLVALFSLLRFQ